MTENFWPVKIVARRQETADIATFDFAHPDGAALPAFAAGAHIDVLVTPGLVRQYSLANDPAERHRYQVGVLKDRASRGGSVAMHELQVGASVRIAGPRNHFPLHDGGAPAILLAGGIGVTPLLCMGHELHRARRDFVLHYCVRSQENAAFLDFLTDGPLAKNIELHVDDGAPAQRFDLNAVLGAAAADAHVYVCGPAGFMAFCLGAAERFGFGPDRLHREYFGAAPVDSRKEIAFDVKIASTGQVFHVPGSDTILNVLRQAGVDVPASCETGVCGTCLVGVAEGTPDHRDVYLTEAEKAAGDVLLPCCSRSKTALLVLEI